MAATGAGDGDADESLKIRRLHTSDYEKGFVDLLGQLSPSPGLSFAEFADRFADLSLLGDDHVVFVAEDASSGRVVATGCAFVEKKFLRGGGKVGHVEDVVVDAAARGRGLGVRLVRRLVDHAMASGCYKVILDCTPELTAYYAKCGFVEKGVQMAIYF